MTADHVLLALLLALASSLSLAVLGLIVARVERLSAQLAVLTLRVTDLVEALDREA